MGGPPEATEEEKFWQEKQRQATVSYGAKKVDPEQKRYELLLENQVDFVKSSLLEGLILEEKKTKRKKKKSKR